MGANKTQDFFNNKNNKGTHLAARIKIIWEEQLVDPPFEYITSVFFKHSGWTLLDSCCWSLYLSGGVTTPSRSTSGLTGVPGVKPL